jgi:hypothetical protein
VRPGREVARTRGGASDALAVRDIHMIKRIGYSMIGVLFKAGPAAARGLGKAPGRGGRRAGPAGRSPASRAVRPSCGPRPRGRPDRRGVDASGWRNLDPLIMAMQPI